MSAATKLRCRGHEWVPLFAEPPRDSSKDVLTDWLGMLLHAEDKLRTCSCCGALGDMSRGRRRAGRPARIYPLCVLVEDDGSELRQRYNARQIAREAEYRERAAAWARKIGAG